MAHTSTELDPKRGETWRSRDPRDDGLTVTVLDVENGFVRIQRLRKTTVSLVRFRREYEPVHPRGRGATSGSARRSAAPTRPVQPALF